MSEIVNPLPRAAFFDVDGTLVGSSHKPSESTRAMIRAFEHAGIRCGVATGRPWFGVSQIVRDLGMTGPSLVSSGSAIMDSRSGAELHTVPIDRAEIEELAARMSAARVYFELYSSTDYYAEDPEHPSAIVQSTILGVRPKTGTLASIPASVSLIKLSGLLDPAGGAQRIQAVMQGFPNLTLTFASGPSSKEQLFYNLTHRDASRENGLKKLCELIGLPPGQLLAAGDSESDKHFIETCRYGIAMKDAPQDVREAASFIAGTAEEDGLSIALRALFPSLG